MLQSPTSRTAAVDRVRFASRQVWLAGLGAAVVTREWAGKEAGKVFGTLVHEGAVVESRALRIVGHRVEDSVSRASALIGRARTTLRSAVNDYAAPALTRVRKSLASIEMPTRFAAAASRPAATPRRKAAKRVQAVKRATAVKRTVAAKRGKRAAKR